MPRVHECVMGTPQEFKCRKMQKENTARFQCCMKLLHNREGIENAPMIEHVDGGDRVIALSFQRKCVEVGVLHAGESAFSAVLNRQWRTIDSLHFSKSRKMLRETSGAAACIEEA